MPIIIAFDVEADGLLNHDIQQSEYQPPIIEFGATKYGEHGLKPMLHFETFIKPPRPVSEVVQKITKIDNAMLKDAPSFKLAFPKIAEFFTGADLLITFNGPGYDLPVLMHNLIANQLQYQFPWPRKHVDLMTAASDYMGMAGKTGNKNPKLIELYKFLFEEEFPDAHRALSDAKATMRCAIELVKRKVIKI
jgi:DNA polymerase III alpha subunit (gram-positive type)